MQSALIIIDKAPYGYENALSGIYIAIAGVDKGIPTDILLMGDGIYTALKDQSSEKTIGYPSVGDLTYSIFPDGNLFIHMDSLTRRGIAHGELVEIAELVDDKTLYNILKSKKHIIKV